MWRRFGIREDPFGAVPDPRFLYLCNAHREALASLQYGFLNNRGFSSLIAEPGLGKTTLLFSFLEKIRAAARTVFLFDSYSDGGELLTFILRDLGIAPGTTRIAQHEQLQNVLLAEARAGKRVVVVIDEAQHLGYEALEAVRMLSNFETPQAKLLQIVLAGQPALGDRLSEPHLVQLRQRISTVCRLAPFSEKETEAYIDHRLREAGYPGPGLFTSEAMAAIYTCSRGVPRIINHLCFNSLSLCCALGRHQVDHRIVAEVVADQRLTTTRRNAPELATFPPDGAPASASGDRRAAPPRWLLAMTVILALAAVAAWSYHNRIRGAIAGSQATPVSEASTPSASKQIGDVPPQFLSSIEVTVAPKQTLTEIANQQLGGWNQSVLQEIEALNPGLHDPDHIETGQKLRLPTGPNLPATNRQK